MSVTLENESGPLELWEDPAARWEMLAREVEGERPPVDRLVEILRAAPEPLFALMDAARTPKVLTLLRASGAEHQSLYEGRKGEQLSEEAPYLVRLPPDSRLLPVLARASWGDSWGVFLTSTRSFTEVRKHFRRFLIVTDEGGKELYFRFYDPRVTRVFMSVMKPLQASEFFEGISAYLVEQGDGRTLVRYAAPPAPAVVEVIAP
jgi:hypothetical protein